MVLKMLLATFIWGSAYVSCKVVINDVPPLSTALVRYIISSIILVIIYLGSADCRHDFNLLKANRKLILVFVLAGFVGVYVRSAAFLYGLQFVNAGLASLLMEIGIPICQFLLSAIFLGERLSFRKTIAFVISALGLGIAGSEGMYLASFSLDFITGLLMIGLAVLGFSTYAIISKKMDSVSPRGMLTLSSVAGTFMFMPSVYLEQSLPALQQAPWTFWLNTLYLATFCSAITFIWWQQGLKELGASKIGVYGFLVPIWGLVLSAALLGEHVTGLQLFGSALSIASVWYILRPEQADQVTGNVKAGQ